MSTRRELTSVTEGIFIFKFLVFGLLCTRSYSDVMCWMLPHESCTVCSSSLSLLFIVQDAPCL